MPLSAFGGRIPPPWAEYTPSCCSTGYDGGYPVSNSSTPRTVADSLACVAPARPDGFAGREIFALYASPLDQPPINVHSEVEALREALVESGAQARLSVGVATTGSLTKLLTLARARSGLVLHLSAHAVYSAAGEVGLVLEDARGASHVLWRQSLEEVLGMRERGLRNISLLFLSTCWSQELAQIFVECGCRHVIALRTRVNDSAARRFSQHFYLSLGVGEPLLGAWEAARRALSVDPDPSFARQAESFVLFGQRWAEQATLDSLCRACEVCRAAGPPLRGLEDAATLLEASLPPRGEHFVGRAQAMLEVLHAFSGANGRRACAVHGPPGMGKSVLGVELAHFASAPGRLFSCSARVLRLESSNLLDILSAVEDELEGLAGQLRTPVRPASGDSRSSAASSRHSTPQLRSEPSEASLHSSPSGDLDALAWLLPMRQRIRRGFQQLERARRGRRLLLVVDDAAGALSGSQEARTLLGELLDHTHQLQVLVCSEEPIYRSLGATKVVNVQLRGLPDQDAARLLLQRIHRPLGLQDFAPLGPVAGPGAVADGAQLPSSASRATMEATIRQLCGHPLLARLQGHPGRVRTLASRVVPGGPSLLELAATNLPELPPLPSGRPPGVG